MPPATHRTFSGRVPNVASDGRNFLVVSSVELLFYSVQQFAMLVDPEGRPLLHSSLVFGSNAGPDIGVASSGRRYLMAWGGLGETSFALIDNDGRLLTSPSIRLHEATRTKNFRTDMSGRRPVAWTGSEFVVLTDVERNISGGVDSTLVASRISESADIIQKEVALGKRRSVDIAARNGVAVVLSSATAGLEVQTLTGAGVVSNSITLAPRGFPAAIAAGDDGFLVAWNAAPENSATGPVYVQHLDPLGEPLGTPRAFSTSLAGTDVTWSDGAYLVAWTSPAGLQTARVVRDVEPILDVIVASTDARNPSIASNGSTPLLVWEAASNIYAKPPDSTSAAHPVQRIPRSQYGAVAALASGVTHIAWLDEGVLARSGTGVVRLSSNHCSGHPGIAAEPSSRIVVWAEGIECQSLVKASTSDMSGTVVLGRGVTAGVGEARTVWTGRDYVVVWTSHDGLHYARVSAEGKVIQEERSIGSGGGEFALAASNSSVFVVWVGGSAIITDATSTITDTIMARENLPNSISVASDGSDFLVTWISKGGTPNDYIAGRRVGSDGKALGEMRIYSDGGDRKLTAQTFWTGSNYLTVWGRPTDAIDDESELWAIRIGGDGTLIDYPSQRIGSVRGDVTSWSYERNLAVTYVRSISGAFGGVGQAFFRVTVTPRFRAARMR